MEVWGLFYINPGVENSISCHLDLLVFVLFWVFFGFSCRDVKAEMGKAGNREGSRDREGRGGGSRREVALQQLPAGVLGHMGCLQCPVRRDRKYRVVLALPDSPNVPVAQCDPFIPPQQDKRCAERGK